MWSRHARFFFNQFFFKIFLFSSLHKQHNARFLPNHEYLSCKTCTIHNCTKLPYIEIQRAIVENTIMSNYTATSIHNSSFNNWMPLVGVYIAGATFVCVIAIVVDLIEGLQKRQYWIPSSWSSLNATSIIVITAASKLTLNLTTSMPRQIDQLSKLSTSAFVCIALANVAPSVGKLEISEFRSNAAALSFVVISSVVGLCIQLKNGVIFTFKIAHITMVVMTGILLVRCVLSIATTSFLKGYFNAKYETQRQEALKYVQDMKHPTTDKLRNYLERFSMLAHSGCSHFNMARYLGDAIYAVCGLVAAMTFFTILIACITQKDKFLGPTSCSGTSNYGWSALYILISQTIAVGVGSIVLCIRGSHILAVQSRKVDSTSTEERNTNTPKEYWNQKTWSARWYPFLPYIEYRQQKPLGHLLIFLFYVACFRFRHILSRVDLVLFHSIPMLFWSGILYIMPACPHHDEDDPVLKELRPYFLQLGGYDKFEQVEGMMKSILHVSKECLNAEERETEHLKELLWDCSDSFEGAVKFQIPPFEEDNLESPPNNWALSVLTLTWLATALPNIDGDTIDRLKKSVMEGLVYVKLIEDNFNNKQELANFRLCASFLWHVLYDGDILEPWIRHVPKDGLGDNTARETLRSIEICARNSVRVLKFIRKLGAHYLYGVCKMILGDCESNLDDSTLIFDKLRRTISDILGACLTNLKYYFLLKCERSSSIEKRRDDACKILKLFGETEEIMNILEDKQIPDHLTPENMVIMDNWRQSQSHLIATSSSK